MVCVQGSIFHISQLQSSRHHLMLSTSCNVEPIVVTFSHNWDKILNLKFNYYVNVFVLYNCYTSGAVHLTGIIPPLDK